MVLIALLGNAAIAGNFLKMAVNIVHNANTR